MVLVLVGIVAVKLVNYDGSAPLARKKLNGNTVLCRPWYKSMYPKPNLRCLLEILLNPGRIRDYQNALSKEGPSRFL